MKLFLAVLGCAAAAVLAASCGSSASPVGEGNRTEGSPPIDAFARFEELTGMFKQAQFHVIYRVFDSDNWQLSWMQISRGSLLEGTGTYRWDEVQVGDNGIDARATVANGGPPDQCRWSAKTPDQPVEVGCLGDSYDDRVVPLIAALGPPFQGEEIRFDEYRVIAGVRAECFRRVTVRWLDA